MSNELIYLPLSASSQSGGASPSVPPAHTATDPGKDFYKHVNEHWIRKARLPPFKSSYGVSEEIEADVTDSLLTVIERTRRSHPDAPLSKLATSFQKSSVQHTSLLDLRLLISRFECISDAESLARTIGHLNRIQAHAPLSCVIQRDTYDSSVYSIYLYEPSLGLPDDSLYEPRTRILSKYKRMLKQVGTLLHIESLERAASLEDDLIPFLSDEGDLEDPAVFYNAHTWGGLRRAFPGIPWKALLEGWGLSDAKASRASFIVTNERYLRHLQSMIRSLDWSEWRRWLCAQVVSSFLEYLPPPFDDLHYELFGKTLKGSMEKLPQKYLTMKVLRTFAAQDLSRVFVEQNVPPSTKTYATRLVKSIKHAAMARIRAQTWMSPDTKQIAIRKVDAMGFQVAYPRKWYSETAHAAMDAATPLGNIFRLAEHDTERMMADLGHRRTVADDETWEDGSFEVNAYYYPEGNAIVVPAGILRAPFFDLRRSFAWNLGAIGVVIGHEITHGFDADGRFYNAKGNYEDWWTAADSRAFEKRSRAVVDLFDDVKTLGGKVDGEQTLSENLADLGGMAIALEVLRDHMKKETDRKQALKDFFTSYAVSWRTKDREEKAKQSLLTDVHAPPILRVNTVVHQFAEFYEAFDLTDKDAGWIPPEDRITLW